jgi:hypothetical protein
VQKCSSGAKKRKLGGADALIARLLRPVRDRTV